ncbi:hypothetical protein GCM10012286_68170 [Streptomyces lasiicapitis]|uniref:Transposase n=1 Tax=Streptomyces lasiicapitis TaxID=1923961 RepID=A0ABQ2MN29_9ACTN|nr:hypothetical protein GCM10012286_68170 [Streptomyces lasiicapitis]
MDAGREDTGEVPLKGDKRYLPCEAPGPVDRVHEQWRYDEKGASGANSVRGAQKPRRIRPG